MINPETLLTVTECQAIDQLLLPAADRFAIRVAVYTLRYLKTALPDRPLDDLTAAQIYEVVAQDARLQAEEERQAGFMTWYGQILMSALKQLRRIAAHHGVAVADLEIEQISQWFQQQCQQRLQSDPPPP
ncbi:hypothetical protein RYO59_000305 [Thermosynechococcaceae cyanobacterium Okahandja]